MEQFKWNYILEDEVDEDLKDEDDGEDDEDDSDVDSEDNATSSPTRSNKKRKYNAVQGIITPGDDDMKANSNMAKSYPYLSRALLVIARETLVHGSNPNFIFFDGRQTEIRWQKKTEYLRDDPISNKVVIRE